MVRDEEDAMTEQPNTVHEPEESTTGAQLRGEGAAPEHGHVRTDGETAVDDALGATDDPH